MEDTERPIHLLVRGLDALERLATANEELIKLAKDERDFGDQIAEQPGPPYCPHCERINPTVTTQADGGGALSNFVLVMECTNCHNIFFGIPQGWMMAPDIETAKQLREGRNKNDNSS